MKSLDEILVEMHSETLLTNEDGEVFPDAYQVRRLILALKICREQRQSFCQSKSTNMDDDQELADILTGESK